MKKLFCAFAVLGLLTVGIPASNAFAEEDADVSAPPPAEEEAGEASNEDAAEADSEESTETEE